ncbi:nitrogen fixation protein VnfA [bacterium BMS3Abin05]|nr:nitrogen fixation protein VnfA [bacterium BMS3Abin05]GBE28381.1 nitrogen fixation protein VnfA [bacterium BMS3Bbin03]HDZ13151.1 GAF domain-containing protein [Bacteroidota bacterium]
MAVKKDSEKKEQTDSLIRKLSILGKINEAVSRTLQLQESMDATLRILQQSYHIRSGAVFLAENGRNLVITASIGYNRNIRKTAYHFGEGLTGRVAETGKPIVVPQVSKEPLFLNRMSSWNPKRDGEQTFIGIPIISDYATLGVLIINLKYNPKRHLSNTLKFLMLVGSALAQPIRFNRLLKMEREKILNERVLLDERLKEKFSFQNIIGNSNEMRDVYEKVAQVARADTTVLIRGESGTGKELIAQAIHFNSARKDKSFIRVNCAAIPESLIESEFFGHEKGAFTGALIRKKGRFELANGGTIFLDEIGELSPLTQVKLLRVLQEHEFEQVGGTETIKVNVRVITATNADLEKLIAGGKFREDLYYRLNVFSIFLPPLRDRRTDILLLADHFMFKYGRKHGKAIKRISTPAIDMLMRYHWPGNVRELENCIERAVLVCEDQVIHSYHLPPTLQTAESSNTLPKKSLEQAVTSYEKELIQDALKSSGGIKAKAARLLDTTERILSYKIEKHGIDISRFKPQF